MGLLSWGEGARIEAEELDRRTDALAHRGPDDRGTWTSEEGRVGLGHRRLSIIDLSPAGRQPLAAPDGSRLVFNGEVYNFVALRRELEVLGHRFESHTDSEVVLHGWRAWGPGCLERLEGMFAFALWDAPARRLVVARDRLGIKPVVWTRTAGRFGCASELAALFAAEPAPARRLDPAALDAYLALGSVPAPRTVWREVRKLLPGHWLAVEATGEVHEQRWWDLPAGSPGADQGELEEQVRARLREAVRSHLVADVPVGAFLSGGLDSSLVAALAAQELPGLSTFSVAFRGHAREDEGGWARKVAQALGTRHHELELALDVGRLLPELAGAFGEPFAIGSALGVHLLAREAAREVKVVLTGDGGDEVFAGYPWHTSVDAQADALLALGRVGELVRRGGAPPGATQRVRWRAESTWSALRRRARLVALPDAALRARRYADEQSVFLEAERAALYAPDWDAGAGSLEALQAPWRPERGDRLAAWRTLDLKTTLPDEMLTKVDLATMRVGLEARVPLLDHRLVELAIRLPAASLVGPSGGKQVLRRLARELLPPEVVARPKHGFDLPLRAWMAGGLAPLAREACEASTLAELGVFDRAALRELHGAFLATPSAPLARQLFTLVWLELWARVARPAA